MLPQRVAVALTPVQTSAPDSPGAWDRLWPLLVTAALSLAVFWFVQLYIMPPMEVRKRREDRWERDVLDLGQLLTFDVPKAFEKVRSELSWAAMLDESTDGNARVEELRRNHYAAKWVAISEYRDVSQRVSWLTDRVVSIHPRSTLMRRLRLSQMGLTIEGLDNFAVTLNDDGIEVVLPENEIRRRDEASHEALKKFIEAVKTLASGPPPRPSSRAGWLARRARQKITAFRRRAAARVRRSGS